MAHVPELPELYVCENCHGVYAGTVTGGTAADHTYEAPTECAACGNTDFVGIEGYPYFE